MKNTYVSFVRTIDKKATGLVLYNLRVNSGYTTEDICCFMGLESPRAIYKWESGQSLPVLDHLMALCQCVYHVPIESVIRYTGESSDSPVARFLQKWFCRMGSQYCLV